MGVPSCPCLQFTAAVRQLEEEREGLGHEPPAPLTKDKRGQSCRMERTNLESRKSPKPKSKGFGKSLDRSGTRQSNHFCQRQLSLSHRIRPGRGAGPELQF